MFLSKNLTQRLMALLFGENPGDAHVDGQHQHHQTRSFDPESQGRPTSASQVAGMEKHTKHLGAKIYIQYTTMYNVKQKVAQK